MDDLINLIPLRTIRELETNQTVAVVLTLRRLGKEVTGKTIRSIYSESVKKEGGILEVDTFGAGHIEYIISGKSANTKLPVEKIGGEFRLVKELREWKQAVGFGGSDFLLARDIAENPRLGVDVAGKAIEIYGNQVSDTIADVLARRTIKEFKKDLDIKL